MSEPRVASRALIYHPEGQAVFLGRRSLSDRSSPGKWALLGGKVDPGETPLESLIRELHEEAGVEFAPEEEFAVHEHNDWRTHFFIGRIIGSVSLALAEHDTGGYFFREDITGLDMAFDHKPVVLQFLESTQ